MSAINKHKLKESHIVQPSQNQCLWRGRLCEPRLTDSVFIFFSLNGWFFFHTYSHGYRVTVTAVGITHLPCERSVTLCQLHYSIPFGPVSCFLVFLHFGRGSEPHLEDRALCSRSCTKAALWCLGQMFVFPCFSCAITNPFPNPSNICQPGVSAVHPPRRPGSECIG